MNKIFSIYEALLKYKEKDMSSFHTPGHKNNFFKSLADLDYTELEDTDDLYNPKKSLLKTEIDASKIFKSGCTLISAGGCTLCIQTMLKLFCGYGSKIICSRIIHKSAVNAMAILNIIPVWLLLKTDKASNFYLQPTSEEIKKLLEKNKDIKAVYITSPDYYGTLADIKSISDLCKKYNVLLLVDNAHGSHLAFLEPNLHPLNLGADATADSIHKTLPALTGSALLHLKNKKLFKEAKKVFAFFGSTSPSFPIMSSVDICTKWLKEKANKEFFKLVEKVKYINNLAKSKGITISNLTNDPTRICFNINSIGFTGHECAEHFRKYKIEPEFYDERFIVLIPSPFNTEKDFSRLIKSVNSLPNKNLVSTLNTEENYLPEYFCSIYEALFERKSKTIKTNLSVNKVAAETCYHCPPGIPLVIPGEVINKNTVKILLESGIDTVRVLI